MSYQPQSLDGGFTVLVGADTNNIFHRQHEDFAVTNLARLGGSGDDPNSLAH